VCYLNEEDFHWEYGSVKFMNACCDPIVLVFLVTFPSTVCFLLTQNYLSHTKALITVLTQFNGSQIYETEFISYKTFR
jgi:hypothetical protein